MTWMDEEPVRGGLPDPRLLALDGVERMHAVERGLMPYPPNFHLLGIRPVSANRSSVTATMPCSPWLQTHAGVFFAGTAALVADAAFGSAVLTSLGPGAIAVTSDLSLNFLRPVRPVDGHLISRARPIDVGRTLGLAEGLVEDGRGRLVAHGTTRCFITDLGVPAGEAELPQIDHPSHPTPDPHERPLPDDAVDPSALEVPFIQAVEEVEAGKMPEAPFARLFSMGPATATEGAFQCNFPASLWFASPAGTVYGGILAYLIDTVMTGAMSTTLRRDEVAATLDLKVQFLRPVVPDGRRLRGEAEVVHRGRSFAAAQGRITNEEGKQVVLASSSAAIRSGKSWDTFAVADEAADMLPNQA